MSRSNCTYLERTALPRPWPEGYRKRAAGLRITLGGESIRRPEEYPRVSWRIDAISKPRARRSLQASGAGSVAAAADGDSSSSSFGAE